MADTSPDETAQEQGPTTENGPAEEMGPERGQDRSDMSGRIVQAVGQRTRKQTEAMIEAQRACMNARFELISELKRAQAEAMMPVQLAQRKLAQAAATASRDEESFRAYLDAQQELFAAQRALVTGTDLQDRQTAACRAFDERQKELNEAVERQAREAHEAFLSEMKAIWADLDPSEMNVTGLAWSQLANAGASCF